MKRREWIFAAIGVVLLLAGLRIGAARRLPEHDMVSEETCRMPVRVIGSHTTSNQPSVIILHGLGANQVVMEAIAQALASAQMTAYVFDLPGHGNNAAPFSFQQAESCMVEAVNALERRGQIQLDKTVFVGHSMGGALAIRLADYFPAAATVAISPAPLVQVPGMPPGALLMGLPRRMPVNLLVLVGQFDFPFLKRSAEHLVAAAGGQRFHEPDDFQERRAMRLMEIPAATHTSLIYNVRVWQLILNNWLSPSLAKQFSSHLSSSLFIGPMIGVLGLAFMFPLTSSAISAGLHAAKSNLAATSSASRVSLLSWPVAGLLTVSALKFFVPLQFLHMYNADYLTSCLLLAGIALCALLWSTHAMGEQPSPAVAFRAVGAGALMGMTTMLVVGAWMNWALTDTWLNAARWVRFPVILIACVPYALAEEWATGVPSAGNWFAKVRCLLLFGALRLLLWLSMLFAVYVYSSGQILLTVLVFFMGFFSLVVRFGADAVRRRTGSPAGAAAFTAILMAWFIAAVFPLT